MPIPFIPRRVFVQALALVLACASPLAPAQPAPSPDTLSPAEHVARAWALYRQGVSTEEEHMQVQVTRAGQPPDTKTLTRWSRLSAEGDKVVVRFSAPAADRGLGLLILSPRKATTASEGSGTGTAAQVWLRQPSWTQARRIAADREGRPFGDTDLSFEDNRLLLGENTADFHYRLLDTSAQGWWIEARPRDGVVSAYGMRHLLVTPQHAVAEIRGFDRQMVLLKTQRHDRLEQEPTGRWRARLITVTQHQDRSQTVLDVSQRKLNPGTPDRVFTPHFLLED
jgi:hypothetical protein